MPPSVNQQVMDLPIPMSILKPIQIEDTSDDLEYTSFVDAKLLFFSDKHQPSLAVASARTAEDTKKKAALNNSELGSSRVANSIARNQHRNPEKQECFQDCPHQLSPRRNRINQLPKTSVYLQRLCRISYEATTSNSAIGSGNRSRHHTGHLYRGGDYEVQRNN
jgi:hypothetical protein